MAHKTHRWSVLSVQHSMDLQHVSLTWECKVRGCWQTATYYYTFRRPRSQLGNSARPEPDWVRKDH